MGMNTASVQRLYVAYFNRPADPLAIADYEAMLPATRVATQAELLVLAETYFSPSTEYQTNFDGLGNADIVNELYLNIFGRPADVGGLKAWTAALNNKTETVASLALSLSFSAQLTDAAVVNARIEAATAYTNGLDTAEEILGYQGPAAIASATAYLKQISGALPTTDAAITAQKTTAIANVDASIKAMVEVGGPAGPEQTLTTGIDDLTGTDKRDTFKGYVDAAAATNSTLQGLDQIDGGDGNDTLEIAALTTLGTADLATNLTSVEAITARAIGDITINTSAIAGVTSLTTTDSADNAITAAATTDVTVSGGSGTVTLEGGKDVTVTDAVVNKAIAIGANTAVTGAIKVTDASVGTANIHVDGKGAVTINATGSIATGNIEVGETTEGTGAIKVTSTSAATPADTTSHQVKTNGGSTVVVTQAIDTTNAAADATANTITHGAVDVDAGNTTTSVTVTADAANTAVNAVTGIAAVAGTQTVTFSGMTAGQDVTVDGLKFTAAKTLTGAEVAQAYANLSKSATQNSAGPSANGVFSSTTSANFTSGEASAVTATTSSVTFTQVVPGTGGAIVVASTGATLPVVAAGTTGVALTKAVTGEIGSVSGAVAIDDNATKSVTDITLSGAGTATLGGASSLDKLANLSLANSDAAVTVTTAGTGAVTLNLDKVGTAAAAVVSIDGGGASITGATINATTASKADFVGDAVTALTVNATGSLDLTGSSMSAVKTMTVTGAGAVTLDEDGGGAALTSIDASANTGGTKVSLTLGTGATFKGGDGADTVTFGATTKAQTLGGGNDVVTVGVSALGAGGSIDAGAGVNTLVMTGDNAETATADAAFEATISNFSALAVDIVANGATDTINLANLDDINYVVTPGAVAAVTAVAQITAVTATGATDNALDTVSLDVGGATFTSDAGVYADGAAIAAELAGKINAAAAYGAAAVGNVITITAAVAGTAFTVANPTATNGAGGADTFTITQATPTPNVVGVAAGTGLLALSMANNATVQMTGTSKGTTVTVADAATGTSDVVNVDVKGATADVAAGLLTAANVETVNVTSTDGQLDNNADGVNEAVESHSLTLTADKATTVTVGGDADMNLTLTGSTLVTAINAASLTGSLTVTTAVSTGAVTVTGGSGADVLTSSGSADVLKGGDGADQLTGSTLTTLTGGAGADTFNLNVPTNLNSYSTITDATAGDIVDLGSAATTAFISTATVLADTASFQDYANAATNALGADTDDATWFQYGGNTYIVKSGDNAAAAGFVDGTDAIIKLTGLVNLATASFNSTDSTLEIG